MLATEKRGLHVISPTHQQTWLVTGAAGFIGSHLIQTLLSHNQTVIAFDNFSTGKQTNLDDVCAQVTDAQWSLLRCVDADIRTFSICTDLCEGVDVVVHLAALGSVHASVDDPRKNHAINVDGFFNIIQAAHAANVKRFVYASSSAVYGDDALDIKQEDSIGNPLSPYAATKRMNEIYAQVFATNYGLETIGLRFFNVFGPRQDPNGDYAAVIPQWINAFLNNDDVIVYGDGKNTRDFCYIDNVVQAMLLAALTDNTDALNQVYNIGLNTGTSLLELFAQLRDVMAQHSPECANVEPTFKDFREGDVRFSQADIQKAVRLLGYKPKVSVEAGLRDTVGWFLRDK